MRTKQKDLLFVLTIVVCVASFHYVSLGAVATFDEILVEADRLYAYRDRLEQVEQSVVLLENALHREQERDPEIRDADLQYELLWRLAQAYEWLGRMNENREEQKVLYEKGKEYASAAVASNENGYEGYYWYALTLGRVGELQGILNSLSAAKQMRGYLERVIALHPEHAGAHYALGTLYRLLPGWPLAYGDKKKALEYMEKAVELWPENTTYLVGLAEALLALKQYDRAEKTLRKVLDLPLTPGEHVESRIDKEEAKALLEKHFK